MNILLILTATIQLPNGVYYLQIQEFDWQNFYQFIQTTNNLPVDSEIKGLILDLRNNPGGSINLAVQIAEFWISKDSIIYERVDGYNRHCYFVKSERENSPFKNIPTVILVNHQTASAAELLALTLKLNKKAIIIGERTFGKGLIIWAQSNNWLSIGYWRVKGVCIQGRGIRPTIFSKKPLERAIKYFERRTE